MKHLLVVLTVLLALTACAPRSDTLAKAAPACISADEFSAALDPIELLAVANACAEHGMTGHAMVLLLVASLFEEYDMQRAGLGASYPMLSPMRMKQTLGPYPALAGVLSAYAMVSASDIDQLMCELLRRTGPPRYRPDYLAARDTRAFFGKVPSSELAQPDWEEFLIEQSICEGAAE